MHRDTQNRIVGMINALIIVLLFLSCSDPVDDPIPIVAFDDIIVNGIDYPDLQRDKGYIEVPDARAGVRGIILYRHNQNSYIAYEKNCSYRPNEACATVNVHSSGLFMQDVCCQSTFSFPEGTPTAGPAWRPLQKYRTQLNGFTITITDELLQ